MNSQPLAPAASAERAEALYREGDALHDAGRLDEARRTLEAALQADPEHWLARYTLAVVLQDLGRPADAVVHYQRALAVRPTHAKAWNNYGAALQYLARNEEAIAAFRRALALDPAHAGAAANLSGLLGEFGGERELDEARAVLAPFCGGPAANALDLRRALLLPVIAADRASIANARQRMAAELATLLANPPRLRDPLREIGRTPFYLAYQPDNDRPLLEALAAVYRRACPSLEWTAPHCQPGAARPPRDRLRVGFASFFFYSHSVGRVIDGLVERLPRDRFEIVVTFLGGQADDPLAARMAAAADKVAATAYDVEHARQVIAAQELDILCLPDFGMDPLSYFVGFSRLAPVQCTTWGHPETSGLSSIDWFVSPDAWERPGAEADYSERLYRLPGVASPAWYRRPQAQSGRSCLAPADGPRYFCPQTLYKLHPAHDELWRRILAATPGAQLYLVEGKRPQWKATVQARLSRTLGAQAAQVRWLPLMSRGDYQATLADADALLDTIHFVGGNTSFEALSLGKPVVTLPGSQMRSRFTAGLLQSLGIGELVAADADDYVRIAVRLGQDAAWRASLGQRIAAQQHQLFEDDRVVDAWAEFFRMAAKAAGIQGK
jgi:protein O-GlcNAc transferase